ncbi:MAG: copper chaperone PCu(A)C [Microthrixaceae bacterium]
MTNTYSRPVLRRLGMIAAVMAVASMFASCSSDEDASSPKTSEKPELSVSGVWARASSAGGSTAIYLTVTGGAAEDQLIGVASPDLGDAIELHETVVADSDAAKSDDTKGEMTQDDSGHGGGITSTPGEGMTSNPGGQMTTMRQVEAIDVPAGGKVDLAPGGLHVMVLNLHADLSAGDSIPVTFTFKNAGAVETTAEVKEP